MAKRAPGRHSLWYTIAGRYSCSHFLAHEFIWHIRIQIGKDPANGGLRNSIDLDQMAPSAVAGITPRAALELFSVLQERQALCAYEVDVSMYELYCDALKDLLMDPLKHGEKAPSLNIKLAQHTKSGLVEVDGGTVKKAHSVEELIDIMDRGMQARRY